MARTWHVVLALFACLAVVLSFNLDVQNPQIYQGTSGEYFGYTVALHARSGGPAWVVVGAPLGNKTSRFEERDRYGSVFKCESDTTNCEVITIDNSDPYSTRWDHDGITDWVNMEEKTGQWLGATLISTSTRTNVGKLLACAPRYTFRGIVKSGKMPQKRDQLVLGKCFLIRDDLRAVESNFRPCYHDDDGDNTKYDPKEDGVCHAGFSAAMSKDANLILVGTPGRDGVSGSVYYSELSPKFETKTGKLSDGNAMAYAVAMGKFTFPDREDYIISSPRAANLHGKVVAYYFDDGTLSLKSRFILPLPSNEQFGSYFGASLCAVDLNNDGYSDLLVGAPYYKHENGDEGTVYVYMNNGQSPGKLNNVESMTLNGTKTKGALFGYAMAVAGDLNNDGFPDVAISAPYGGKDQGGVVFIYFGIKDGIETTYRQAIEASDISSGVKTFGFSLAGNLDMDSNGYPDLAVGAYSSDKAFLLRSRPIVKMEGKIILSVSQISLEDNKTMKQANDGVLRKSVNVTVCLNYTNQIPLGMPNVTFTVNLDRDRFSDAIDLRRMFFFQNDKITFSITRQMSLTKEKEWHCQFFDTAYLREKEQLQNLVDPLTFDLTFDLITPSSCTSLCPILNDYNDLAQRTVRAEVSFVKQCGVDKICQPDLSIKGELTFGEGDQKELVIGSVKEITVNVMVENKAEDAAYPGMVFVTYPSVIDYASSKEVSCSTEPLKDGFRKADCILGNPFNGFVKKQFDMVFNTQRVTDPSRRITIHLEASSGLVKDADLSNNNLSLPVPVKFETDLSIAGFSKPDQVVYSDKITDPVNTTSDIGPAVKQTVTVRNLGPSPVEFAEVTILVPFKYNKEEDPNYLLYLMEVLVLGNAGSCSVKTNPLGLQGMDNSSQLEFVEETKESIAFKSKSEVNQSNDEEVPCGSDSDITCLKVPCTLGSMKQGDQANIQLVSRFWQNTIIKADVGSLNLTTTAKVVAPSSVSEPSKENNEVKVILKANPKTTPKGKDGKVAAWIIIVSIIGGLLLIGLVVFALYKYGFFKRNQPHKNEDATEEEMQPMSTPPNQV